MRFNRKTSRGRGASRLTFRLWDFTGTALLNLFVFLFLVAYLSPLPFMIISSLTPHDQFLDSNAPTWTARLSPVHLKASQEIRMKRLAPKAVHKRDLAQLVVPVRGGRSVATDLVDLLATLFPRAEAA